ncbi:MAG: AAA family ATPase [bacterium]
MYLNFYNMIREPFHVTPDPSFLFLSPTHKEALASIIYGIEQRKGFISIIGEVGTGKTTIIRSFLERIDRTKIKPVYVFNSNISIKELLKTFFQEMEIAPLSDKLDDLFRQVHEVLIEEYRKENVVVLIVDEAQNMPIETLEQLRVLSNLETTNDKLIQIVLVGQPEFAHKLNLHKLRQLKQRISIQAKINPLTDKESHQYIQHRLSQVTLRDDKIFSKGALKHIVKHAAGIPRSLNILCDNTLIAGYGAQKNPVPGWIAKQVITEFEGLDQPKRLSWRYALALAAVALLFLGFWKWDRIAETLHLSLGEPAAREIQSAAGGLEDAANPRWTPGPAEEVSMNPVDRVESTGVPTATSQTIPAPTPASAKPAGGENRPTAKPIPTVAEPKATPTPVSATGENPEASPTSGEADSKGVAEPTPAGNSSPESQNPDSAQSAASMENPHSTSHDLAVNPDTENVLQTNILKLEKNRAPNPAVPDAAGEVRIMVKPGDMLTKLSLHVYGYTNNKVIQKILENNPHIQNPDFIQVGEQVVFPPLNPTNLP